MSIIFLVGSNVIYWFLYSREKKYRITQKHKNLSIFNHAISDFVKQKKTILFCLIGKLLYILNSSVAMSVCVLNNSTNIFLMWQIWNNYVLLLEDDRPSFNEMKVYIYRYYGSEYNITIKV